MPERVAEPAVLARVVRGTAVEQVIRGDIAVVERSGAIAGAAGDPAVPVALRSAIKPVQAMQFAAVFRDVGATPEELAVACGSHDAEAVHVDVVTGLLARIGLGENHLSCGPQLPYDADEAARRRLSGAPLRRIDNNCSGKHAGMLAACVANGWPTEGYARRDHPLQQAIEADIAMLTRCATADAPWGIDGCGLPTFALPLSGLARAFVADGDDRRLAECFDAMAAHPVMVGGTARFDTVLMTAAGGRLVAKGGACAVWVAVARPGGPAVALKLEAGAAEHLPVVACAVLGHLGMAPPDPGSDLATFAGRHIRNREGTVVGDDEVSIPF